MTERPILFSGPMVLAILDGRKTQTRRIVRSQYAVPVERGGFTLGTSPCGNAGDRLWVREGWRSGKIADQFPPRELTPHVVWYEADGAAPEATNGKLRPGMFMPRWASRITLEVVSWRVERLQDITEADCIAEGWQRQDERSLDAQVHADAARDWYADLWSALGGDWQANPWVWCVSFRRLLDECRPSWRRSASPRDSARSCAC